MASFFQKALGVFVEFDDDKNSATPMPPAASQTPNTPINSPGNQVEAGKFEKYFDRLFDQGFISFSNEGQIFVSPYLSPLNTKRLGLIDNKKYDLTLNKKRSGYLEYDRINIFKKG